MIVNSMYYTYNAFVYGTGKFETFEKYIKENVEV